MPSAVNGDKLTLAYWDGSKWVSVKSTVDTATHIVTAQISHFSEYALLAELAPAKFILSDLTIREDTSNPDDPVNIQTVVTNIGGSRGNCTLNPTLNSFGVNKREVNLDAGKSETVNFELKNLMPAKYIVDINGQSIQFTIDEHSRATAKLSPALESAITVAPPPISSSTPIPETKVSAAVMWMLLGVIVTLVLTIGAFILRRETRNS